MGNASTAALAERAAAILGERGLTVETASADQYTAACLAAERETVPATRKVDEDLDVVAQAALRRHGVDPDTCSAEVYREALILASTVRDSRNPIPGAWDRLVANATSKPATPARDLGAARRNRAAGGFVVQGIDLNRPRTPLPA